MPSTRLSKKPKANTPALAASWQFEAIGTQWWIGIYEAVPDETLRRIRASVEERIQHFDATYSRFRTDSLVAKVAQQPGIYQFPEDAPALFALYRRLYDATAGAVTPLIGQVLADAGYDASYSMRPGMLTTPPEWDEVMQLENTALTVTQPVLLDFGAAGKGYLADIVANSIEQYGVERFCVDASGDMVCRGMSDLPLKVGMEHPDDTTQVVGAVQLGAGALCGSAGNRRAWGEYHHVISPATLQSPRTVKAVWVTAETALVADGLTTALFFVPPEKLRSLFTFEYAMIYADGGLHRSPAFPAVIFTR